MAGVSLPQPSSSLASDPQLAPFLAPHFSAVDYLNSTLPSWTPSPQSTIPTASTSTTSSSSLAEIAAQTQSTLTQLNAQLTRLSTTLTALTDDILRAGGRLAYEVELLRGDAGSLGDALAEGLRKDIEHFVPPAETQMMLQPLQQDSQQAESAVDEAGSREDAQTQKAVTRLHTLTLVRDRLDAVVRVFGDAMAWPVAPSDVTLKSSFITVTGPSADSNSETEELERAGKEHMRILRAEFTELLADGSDEGELAALRRLESLRTLAQVWAGTSEEKARGRIVEGLAKMVEERKRGGGGTAGAAGGARSGYGLGAELPSRPAHDRR